MTRLRSWTRTVAIGALVALLSTSVRSQTPSPQTLAQLQFDIVGVRLVIDPPALAVPKNIATQINTALVLPPGIGNDARDALAALTASAVVEAELRGPSIPPTRISVRPGDPIPIPAFALPGDYFLDQIRLVKDGQPLLDATTGDGQPATVVPIRVLNEILVTNVTSRPLSLDEITSRGIVIDEQNFQATNFQVAFNVDGEPFTIDLPVAVPTADLLRRERSPERIVTQLAAVNQALAETVTLPPQFDRPGLNFSIAPLPFFPVLAFEGEEPGFDVPPVTGLVVIPGNIGFLNQFFSVLVMVTNVAPDGTPLVLRDVNATIRLPLGLDRAAGTFEHPGDDPLRLARVEGVGQRPTVLVLQPGPDGELGTADDLSSIGPQQSGDGEFLVEGLREGSHTLDIDIAAVLHGLPSGPVELMGKAAGAVFVRNPTFSITLSHPRTIRSGEPYDLYATVTNTSLSAANLVSVNLDPRSVSGAQLVSDPAVTFDTIAPGQSATATFRLVAQQTGEVTSSSFTADTGTGGSIQLRTGIGERGVPLAPNAIVLPKTADALPASLVAAAQRVLGQAFSIASAPAEALPAGVRFVRRQTVVDRGRELAEAGQRVQFGEPLTRVIQDLLLDWLGNRLADDGFDQLIRSTDAGSAFLREISAILAESVTGPTALDYQREFAQVTTPRAPHLSVIAGASAGTAPVLLRIVDDAGRDVGDAAGQAARSLPYAGLFDPTSQSGNAKLAVIARPEAVRYTVEMQATEAGILDLGIVIPGSAAGQLTQLRYSGVQLAAGGTARVVIDLAAPGSFPLQADGTAPREPVVSAVLEGAPQVLAVRQLESSAFGSPGDPRDPATYGLLLGVLFDKPVAEQSAETFGNYALENNAVIGAQIQPSGRLVYLYLRQPIGRLTERSLTIANVTDTRDNPLGTETHAIQTVFGDGARVFGQVRTADGRPVPGAVLNLAIKVDGLLTFTVSRLAADREGGFDFDFVRRVGQHFALTAQHPITREIVGVQSRVRADGEMILLNPTFFGKGTVRGRVLAADGSIVPNARVQLIPGSISNARIGVDAGANELGEFVFTDAPTGPFTVRAVDQTRGAFGQATGVIPTAGAEAIADVVLINQPDTGGRLVGRVFLSDGLTPAAGFAVYVGQYDRSDAEIAAVGQTTTDSAGSFAFEGSIPQGTHDVIAVDPATGQIGQTRVSVVARVSNSVNVTMEATGAVTGVVFNAQGQPVPGALIAGGVSLGQADANGFFRIEGVPAGERTIEAGDPVSKRRGSARVTVLSGQTVQVAVTLEARATIAGRVLDANGNPVPGATVRIPVRDAGFTFVFANNAGVFTFPDLPLGDYLIQAPGPPKEALIDFMVQNGIDPRSAFTSGDGPAEFDDPFDVPAGDLNAALAAYQRAVEIFVGAGNPVLTGLPPPPPGGFGWTRVRLFQDSTTIAADVRYLRQGRVAGTTVDANGSPIGALVRVSALQVDRFGFPNRGELRRMNSDAATGAFGFDGVPQFDLETFQTAGVRGGDFTLEAATPFSPTIARLRGELTPNTPNLTDVVLRFPPATETNGTISGSVVLPDGVTPAPAGTQVRVSFGDLTLTTDENGRFASLFPIPAGGYTVTAEELLSGLRGQAMAAIPAGGNVDVQIRLLGQGTVTIAVRRANGQPVANATVALQRATFPRDRADGVTDSAGGIRFVNITEGAFSVTATEQGTGLSGRASAAIVRDGDLAVTVTIAPAGRVRGTFLAADGQTPIANAQIVLRQGALQAFATTGSDGRFELLAIPVGRFTAEGSDPLTGRLGRAQGELFVEGDTAEVTIIQLSRGTVTGAVVNADGVTSVAGATVSIESSSFVPAKLQATTRADGSFQFDGVPAGPFSLEARDPVSHFAGRASGELTFEGERVERNVTLEPFGAIVAAVRDTDGNPAVNATVTLSGPGGTRGAAVDTNGEFTFQHLRLGQYRLTARSGADPHNGGEAAVEIEAANQTAQAVVNLRGTGHVDVTVVASDGVSPIASARVVLTASAAAPGATPSPFAGTFTGFTNSSGAVRLDGVPVGAFFVRAESGPLSGLSTGQVTAPNAAEASIVQLAPSGSIAGRVMLPGGILAAAGAIVTLDFQSRSPLQSGVLQVTTGVDGAFAFSGVPLGPFTVSALELASAAVRTRIGTLSADGERLELGDLVLDNAAPRVVSVTPADRSVGVAATGPIVLAFNEPMQPSSFNANAASAQANLFVLRGATRVGGTLSFSSDNQTVTFTPQSPLESGALYTVTVLGGPQGPRDEASLTVLDSFVSSFTVQDHVAPAVVSLSPAAGEEGVLPEAVVRIGFSEAIAPGFSLVLRDSSGVAVPGVVTLAAGNTVAIFSPADFLRPNGSYGLSLENVADIAGNALAGGPFTSHFLTVDTIAPIIAALGIQGTPRAGATVVIQPTLAGEDILRVEYSLGGILRSAAAPPFAAGLELPVNAASTEVVAVAVDRVGNRSAPARLPIDILANEPPTTVLTNVGGAAMVPQGQTLAFDVSVQDDVGLAEVLFSAVGVVNVSDARAVSPGETQFAGRFTVTVPANAPSGGSLTVQAAAVDTAGNRSLPSSVTLSVLDAVRPVVTIARPVNNAIVLPGQAVDVVVSASDDVGLTAVSLACTPAVEGCESRAVGPPAATTSQTFTVLVPETLAAPASIVLLVAATDAAGNSGQSGRTLRIADTVDPVVTSLQPAAGVTQVIQGQTVTLRAQATDNVGVTAVAFQVEGALTAADDVAVSPASTSATALFTFTVPADAPDGGSMIVRAVARDAAANTSGAVSVTLAIGDTAPPSLSVLAPEDGAAVLPGQTLTISARATDDVGVRRIVFSATGAVAAAEERIVDPPATPADATFMLPVPADAAPGPIAVTLVPHDAAGNAGSAVTRTVNVGDNVAPAVTIASPPAGAEIDPREPLTVTVEASDRVGVTEVAFTVSGATAAADTRVISPAAATRTESFSVVFATPPATAGTLTVNATARDAAGNVGAASVIAVTVRDVVPPAVVSVTPADGAIDVDPGATITVRFSEPIDRATVTDGTLRLSAGDLLVPVGFGFANGDRDVTLTPVSRLAIDTTFRLDVETGIRDLAGNSLGALVSSRFTTLLPDTTAPRFVTVAPPPGAVDVSVTAPVEATFSEAVDPASVTAESFRVSIDGTPVAGAFSFLGGNTVVRFTPAAALPFASVVVTELTGAIQDPAGNALLDADGNPIVDPLTFTFLTGTFSITSPAEGAELLERSAIQLEARGSDTIATVTFSVNGQTLPPVSGPPFAAPFTVPSAEVASTLTILAVARDSGGAEVGRDDVSVTVAPGLRAAPRLFGIPIGESRPLRLFLPQPSPVDLEIAVSAANPALVRLPDDPLVLPAGQTELVVPIHGVGEGATSIIAASTRGTAAAMVSISPIIAGQMRSPEAAVVGAGVRSPASKTQVVAPGGTTQRIGVRLLTSPAAGDVTVTVTSSNSTVATVANQVVIPAGGQVATIEVVTGGEGTAIITLRAGSDVAEIVLLVGATGVTRIAPALAPPVGFSIGRGASATQLVMGPAAAHVIGVPLLRQPASAETPVTVTSSNEAVVRVDGDVVIPSGSRIASVTFVTGETGTARLRFVVGDHVTEILVTSGAAAPGSVPLTLARPTGIAVRRGASSGQLVMTPAAQQIIGLPLLGTPAAAETPVTVTSSDDAVATVQGPLVIARGATVASVTFVTGVEGTATLRFQVGSAISEFTVVVGAPRPGDAPLIVAPPVGAAVRAHSSAGAVVVPPGTQQAVGVRLLASPAAGDTHVEIASSHPAVASAHSPVTIHAGGQVALLTIDTGAEGVAVLTLRVGDETRQIAIVVGTPPPGNIPIIVGPIVGIQVEQP